MNKHPEDADISRGDIQCPYVKSRDGGSLCCVLKLNHLSPHADAYGSERGSWYIDPERIITFAIEEKLRGVRGGVENPR